MNRKTIIVLFQLLLSFFSAYAQKQQWLEDSLYSLYNVMPPVRGGINTFLIADNTPYDFTITGLAKLKGFNIIGAYTTIGEFEAHAVIISPKSVHIGRERLKYKKCYRFSVHRYWQVPIWEDIESTYSTTLLMGNSSININRDGYSYLFISNQIKGFYLVSNPEKEDFEMQSQWESTIKNFVHWMTYDTLSSQIDDYIDTSQIMATFRKFKEAHYRREPNELTKPLACVNAEWGLFHEVKNQKWIDDNVGFDEAFHKIIKDYYQPCRNFIGKIDTISLECLYAIDDTYTLQAVWSISGTEKSSGKTMNKTFVAIVTVRKTGDVFKIVGFNRPFREYSLLSDKLGSVFFK
ncbi:MAG: hypothetical protein IJ986_05945 [Bacteroidales bacterium]|nr:hypothetical protein [Bacteroidales bacterium]